MNEKKQIWGNHLTQSPDDLMIRFCAGRDVASLPMADEVLLPFDLWTNRAHAIMLHRQGILEKPVLISIFQALEALEADLEAGNFQLDPNLEDVHINVERYVTDKGGPEAGGRLHTARSRNDQVACDMRLYMRAGLLDLGESLLRLAEMLLGQARNYSDTLMPGFSHHQPAMITTWGHWLVSYVQAILRDLERVGFAFGQVNRNPLGAVAGFGTSWPIDREFTSEMLAFSRVDINTLDCISSRWEHEAQVAQTFLCMMNHLSLMAVDLILLTHPYWNMATLADAYVTGSSIMPQKRNPDFAEVIKGKTAWAAGLTAGLQGAPRGMMSGYNRDSQMTKYAVIDVIRECLPAPLVMKGAIETLQIHPKVMRERLGRDFLMAADFADGLSRDLGLPFRTGYDIAAKAVRLSGDNGEITPQAAATAVEAAGHSPDAATGILERLSDPLKLISHRSHTGGASPSSVMAQTTTLALELEEQKKFFSENKAQIDKTYHRCRNYLSEELK